jgi:vancomycin resistance protein YoaR
MISPSFKLTSLLPIPLRPSTLKREVTTIYSFPFRRWVGLFATSLFLSTVAMFLVLLPALAHSDENPFPKLWSGFSTSLQGRSAEQRHNAALAGRYIDGFIIPPGGMLSFNELVGARNRSKGYDAAPFLNADGILEETPGGGICQLASTVYNAGLLGGLEVVERHPHSRTVLHVPPGRDATIASWRKDLKLRNPFHHPLLVKISSDNNRLTVSLRSGLEKDFTVEVRTEQTQLEPQVVATGKSAKNQKGGRGFATTTWRVTNRNGKDQVELLSEDTYPAPSRILAGGE